MQFRSLRHTLRKPASTYPHIKLCHGTHKEKEQKADHYMEKKNCRRKWRFHTRTWNGSSRPKEMGRIHRDNVNINNYIKFIYEYCTTLYLLPVMYVSENHHMSHQRILGLLLIIQILSLINGKSKIFRNIQATSCFVDRRQLRMAHKLF